MHKSLLTGILTFVSLSLSLRLCLRFLTRRKVTPLEVSDEQPDIRTKSEKKVWYSILLKLQYAKVMVLNIVLGNIVG